MDIELKEMHYKNSISIKDTLIRRSPIQCSLLEVLLYFLREDNLSTKDIVAWLVPL